MGVDLAAELWKHGSNTYKHKEVFRIHKALKASSLLKANGIKIPQVRVIKAAMPGVLKGAGKVLGAAAGVVTLIQVAYNGEIKASNVLDVAVTAVSFIPVVGWVVGGSYFLADVGVRLATDKSIGEHVDARVGGEGILYDF